VTNVTFIFGTSPNEKQRMKGGGKWQYYIHTWKSGGTCLLCPPPTCTHVYKYTGLNKQVP